MDVEVVIVVVEVVAVEVVAVDVEVVVVDVEVVTIVVKVVDVEVVTVVAVDEVIGLKVVEVRLSQSKESKEGSLQWWTKVRPVTLFYTVK